MRTIALATLSTLVALACTADRAAPGADAAVLAAVDAEPRMMRADPAATNYTPSWWTLEPGDRISGNERGSLREGPDSHWGYGVIWVVGESGLEGATPFGAWFSAEDGPAPGEAHEEKIWYMPLPGWTTPPVPEAVLAPNGGGVTLSGEPYTYVLPQVVSRSKHYIYLGHFPVRGENMNLDFDGFWVGYGIDDDGDSVNVYSDAALPPPLRGIVDLRDHLLDSAYNDRKRSFGSEAAFLEAERKRYYGPGASW